MNSSNLTSLPSLGTGEECYGTCNGTAAPTNNSSGDNLSGVDLRRLFFILTIFLICIFGLVGNGTVIWLLGFRMKRNPFTTFILNLAVADFGVLLHLFIATTIYIVGMLIEVLWYLFLHFPWRFLHLFFFFIYSISQFLLAAISIDRCVSVLFPIWHRCHRPTHLSTTVCALIWGISSLLFAIQFTLALLNIVYALPYQHVATGLLCLPLIAISSLILFIKVCSKSHRNYRRRLLITILLTLLFFLIFAFPLSATDFLASVTELMQYRFVIDYSYIGAALNSSVNPLIYFLVGRKKKSQSRENMKAILQRVFKEEEENMEPAV